MITSPGLTGNTAPDDRRNASDKRRDREPDATAQELRGHLPDGHQLASPRNPHPWQQDPSQGHRPNENLAPVIAQDVLPWVSEIDADDPLVDEPEQHPRVGGNAQQGEDSSGRSAALSPWCP